MYLYITKKQMKIKKNVNYLFVLKAAIVWNIVDIANKPKTYHLFKINSKYYITAALYNIFSYIFFNVKTNVKKKKIKGLIQNLFYFLRGLGEDCWGAYK